MCLAIPGEVKSINVIDELMRTGIVSFAGVTREINLSYTPDVAVGDFVLVHVGFSISVIDEVEANQIFKYLNSIDEYQIEADGESR